jgi:hypothetical protein
LPFLPGWSQSGAFTAHARPPILNPLTAHGRFRAAAVFDNVPFVICQQNNRIFLSHLHRI